MTDCITDRDYCLRYKMALEAIAITDNGYNSRSEDYCTMKRIAQKALEEKKK